MILASHQPNFLPYMGVIYKIYLADIFVFSDDVQYSKSGMHNNNYIKTRNGKTKITMPVNAHGSPSIEAVEMFEPIFNFEKIMRMILQEYAKAEHREEGEKLLYFMKMMLASGDKSLPSFNIWTLKYVLRHFGIGTTTLIASNMLEPMKGHKDERLLDMMKQTKATVYLSGDGAAVYHDAEKFVDFDGKKRKLAYAHYEPVKYRQLHGDYIPNLSVIDYIFNEGYKIPEEWKKRREDLLWLNR